MKTDRTLLLQLYTIVQKVFEHNEALMANDLAQLAAIIKNTPKDKVTKPDKTINPLDLW